MTYQTQTSQMYRPNGLHVISLPEKHNAERSCSKSHTLPGPIAGVCLASPLSLPFPWAMSWELVQLSCSTPINSVQRILYLAVGKVFLKKGHWLTSPFKIFRDFWCFYLFLKNPKQLASELPLGSPWTQQKGPASLSLITFLASQSQSW